MLTQFFYWSFLLDLNFLTILKAMKLLDLQKIIHIKIIFYYDI